MRDPAMSERDQMIDHAARATVVVDVDRVEQPPVAEAVDENDRDSLGRIGFQGPRIHFGRHHDHPVHAPAGGAQHRFDLGPIAVRAGDEEVVTALAGA